MINTEREREGYTSIGIMMRAADLQKPWTVCTVPSRCSACAYGSLDTLSNQKVHGVCSGCSFAGWWSAAGSSWVAEAWFVGLLIGIILKPCRCVDHLIGPDYKAVLVQLFYSAFP